MKKAIAISVPVFSVILIILAVLFLKPATTGLAIYQQNTTSQKIDADVTLKTSSKEVIPTSAIIEISLDNDKSKMTISEFIEKTGEKYEIKNGEIPEFGFFGLGYTGDHIYKLNLSDFDIDRELKKGEHTFITKIIYLNRVLYQKENNIMKSE